ncbi:nucleoside triphosphate pyrophosphohydrolase [Rosenbergiella australiborealis]|uniref:Nucleoside triphosphate pyrophosphohydrolase n=1 Tax=Rosenbergiella australiborealis TaxID=1544696 RepID=A0ABS5T6I8_9GAMM|nr:nucleoside triphosphate pyrophosphohydrolase [Rosenbergiella australiborealis]MBT0727954.1 nucleoside triphosphate pyrophosphohydrolase [Rosenbergiella australiborealis]
MSDSSLSQLLSVMQRLRDPEQGCVWDKQQTFASIAPYTLEECYEVLEAISRQDFTDLKQELGDLLFQIVFYAQMASEQGHFNFDDICQTITQKLIRRHPELFHPQGPSASWEQIKQQERQEKQQYSLLDNIPHAMPALLRADKIQQRCQTVGFDWETLGPVVDKVKEELEEVMEEATKQPRNPERLEEELGDLLFATVNLTRHLGSRAETTLHKANVKFERRFRHVEQIMAKQGLTLEQASLAQMESAWQQVKYEEKAENESHAE